MSNLTIVNVDIIYGQESSNKMFSENVTLIFQWAVFTVLCQAIDLFGIGSNIINIICFVKQGFKDPVNVSLLGLTISDLCSLITLVWTAICVNPALRAADLPFESLEVQHLTSGMPHATFTQITGCITALITMERCLCITSPLKVKNIVTSKRVTITIIFIYLILIASVSPVYVINKLGMKYFPALNKTMIGLVFTEDREVVMNLLFLINNVCVPFSSFTVITICTITLILKLEQSRKWLKTSTSQADVSIRNQKVAKMVLMISALFIVCFIPISVIFLAMFLVPGLTVDGKYVQILIIMGGIGYVLESINSSMNIFIYYHMSSKFKATFRQLFSIKSKH